LLVRRGDGWRGRLAMGKILDAELTIGRPTDSNPWAFSCAVRDGAASVGFKDFRERETGIEETCEHHRCETDSEGI
jgi:hypothetical protein